jgi:hypothetical protein
LAAGAASAVASSRIFYLSPRVHQCLIGTASPRAKTVIVVPCSNPAHNLEVYAVGHGGWGHNSPPSNAYALVRGVCLSAYQRFTGHSLPNTAGWQGYWPDPGAETTRYGDKVVCSYRTWPTFRPLGSGWHVPSHGTT